MRQEKVLEAIFMKDLLLSGSSGYVLGFYKSLRAGMVSSLPRDFGTSRLGLLLNENINTRQEDIQDYDT